MSDEKALLLGSTGHAMERQKLDLTPDAFVARAGTIYRLVEVLDFDTVVGVDVGTGRTQALRIGELKPVSSADDALQVVAARDIEEIADEDWRIAETRYAAIKPLLDKSVGRAGVADRQHDGIIFRPFRGLCVDGAQLFHAMATFFAQIEDQENICCFEILERDMRAVGIEAV